VLKFNHLININRVACVTDSKIWLVNVEGLQFKKRFLCTGQEKRQLKLIKCNLYHHNNSA